VRTVLAPFILGLSVVACNAVVGWNDLTLKNAPPTDDDDDETDAGTTSGTVPKPKDASAGACDLTKPFGAPVTLPGPITSSKHEAGATLTANELTIFFQRTTGFDGGAILTAKRGSTADAFGEPTVVENLSTSGALYAPSIDGDGLTLFYGDFVQSDRTQLFFVHRDTPGSAFSAPLAVAKLASAFEDTNPFVTRDGAALFFTSRRGGTGAEAGTKRQIWQSELDAFGEYAKPKQVTELVSTAEEASVAVTPDRLTIYFGSSRAGGLGNMDIWTAHRAKDGDPWKDIQVVPNVNTPDTDFPSWISPDGCRLYLSSAGNSPGDMKVATRP